MKINFGSGHSKLNGWINVDKNPKTNPDIIIDLCSDLSFLENSKINFVYSEHFVEHLTKDESIRLLSTVRKNLTSGGIVRFATLDLDFVIDSYLKGWQEEKWTKNYPEIKNSCDMINSCFYLWGHKYLFNEESLKQVFLESGFNKITRVNFKQSQFPELRNLETRIESKLIIEASLKDKFVLL